MSQYLHNKTHIGILLLRLFIGIRIFYGVIDNVFSWDRMLEFSEFLAAYHFPVPVVSAVVSVAVQFIGSILIILGYKTRQAAFILSINFLIAILMVHLPSSDTFDGMTPVLAMFFGCLTLLFTGADKIAIDYRVSTANTTSP